MAIILDNAHLTELLEDANHQMETLESLLYTQYKQTVKLSQSISFRGAAADTLKGYFSDVTMNHIHTYLNLLTDVKDRLTEMKDRFLELERRESGKVSDTDLSDAQTSLGTNESTFQEIDGRITSLNHAAATYISVVNVLSGNVNMDFEEIDSFFTTTKENLEATDQDNLRVAEGLMERIQAFYESIRQTHVGYFDSTGNIKLDRVAQITQEDWYVRAPSTATDRLVMEDPFFFDTNHGAVHEGQFAQGWASDTFVTAGYSAVSGNTLVSWEGKNGTASASGSVAEASVNGQLTEYVTGSASAEFASGSGTVRGGFGDGYYGYSLDGEARFAGAEGNVQVGPDEANLFLNGSAEVLSANGFVKQEFEDMNNYAVGFKGEAIGAQVEGGFGLDLFSIQDTSVEHANVDSQGNESNQSKWEAKDKISLLGFNIDGSIGPQVGAGFYLETQQAAALGPFSMNSTTVSISGKLGLGLDLDLTIPTFGFNF